MGKRNEINLFDLIFCDAQILDVDFSEWDRCIRLYVVGLDVEYPVPDKLPLFVVEFINVLQFSCKFRHFAIRLKKESRYFQWNIQESKVSTVNNGLDIKLFGAGVSPHLEIICEKYEIRKIPHSLLDNLFPNWKKPYGPLVRPNVEKLSTGYNIKQKK